MIAGAFGGAFYVANKYINIIMNRSLISTMQAGYLGAGFYINQIGNLLIDDSTFSDLTVGIYGRAIFS